MDVVGRSWYVEIIQGRAGAQAFLGTRHVATGDQIWLRLDCPSMPVELTEHVVLDELYGAVLALMEATTHVG